MIPVKPVTRVCEHGELRFTPYHVCTSVNLADTLVGVRGGVVETVWPIAARAKTR